MIWDDSMKAAEKYRPQVVQVTGEKVFSCYDLQNRYKHTLPAQHPWTYTPEVVPFSGGTAVVGIR